MSDRGLSRRAVTIGGGIATALGLAALGVSVPRWLGKHYRKTPYDDLLGLLTDRDTAVKIGRRGADVLRHDPVFTSEKLAAELRKRVAGKTLAQVVTSDAAEGRVIEANGWVMPTALVLLCTLAAAES